MINHVESMFEVEKCQILHPEEQKQKQSQWSILKASIDKLTYEKMIIMQGIIDNFTVIERYVMKQLKRKRKEIEIDPDYETCQEYKKSRKK